MTQIFQECIPEIQKEKKPNVIGTMFVKGQMDMRIYCEILEGKWFQGNSSMRDFTGLEEILHPTIPIRKKASEDAHNPGGAPASSDQREPKSKIPKKTRAGQGLEE